MKIGLDFYMNRVRVEEQVTTLGGQILLQNVSVCVPLGYLALHTSPIVCAYLCHFRFP